MFKPFFVIATLLLLTACSSSLSTQNSARYTNQSNDEMQMDNLIVSIRTNQPHNLGSKFENTSANNKLSQVFQEWANTRYRMGGTGKRGIDCSAFMQKTFEQAFGMRLPRSTAEQRHIGKAISKSQLKTGDLVFFRKNRHVGVYMGNGRFMHASSSQGVTISSLSESYWARTYTQSRRVL